MSASPPDNMEAVLLGEHGAVPVVRRVPLPRPEDGEVLVRMAAAPVNPSDLAFLEGMYAYRKPLPAVPGIEGSGTVVAAGKGLMPRLLLGRRVACSSSTTRGGTWAEYMVTSASLCVPLDRSVSLEQGATLLVNPLTALALTDVAKKGKHAAVVVSAAASSLGRMIVRLCLRDALPVVCVVRRPEQAELLQNLGAEHVLDTTTSNFAERLADIARKLNASLILDGVAGELTGILLEACPAGTSAIVYSDLSQRPCVVDSRRFFFERKRIRGFYLADWVAGKNLVQALLLARRAQGLVGGALQTTIRRRVPLSSVGEALALYRSDMTAGKVLLVADQRA